MKHILFTLIFILFLSTSAVAQLVYPLLNYGHPPPQAVINLDYPPQGTTFSQTNAVFAGWAFNCAGTFPIELKLWIYVPGGQNNGEFVQWPSTAIYGISRPDVASHYQAVNSPCNIPEGTGWHLYPTTPLPVGAVAYFIQAYLPLAYWIQTTGELKSSSASIENLFILVRY